jgi:hypothetical protein
VGERAKGNAQEAEVMTAVVSGYVAGSLMGMPLTPPVTLEDVDSGGVVRLRLASGMLVTVRIQVEPNESDESRSGGPMTEHDQLVEQRTVNYLHPGAMANGRPARMARYFGQTMESPGAVAIVATFGPTSWRAYIGSASGWADYDDAAERVASWGVKLDEADARHFFPEVVEPYDAD